MCTEFFAQRDLDSHNGTVCVNVTLLYHVLYLNPISLVHGDICSPTHHTVMF